MALLASGRVDIKSGDSQAALDPLNKALSLTIQFDNQEQKGSVLQALGIAYQQLNKPDDALQNFKQALELKRKIGDQHGIAKSLGQIAQIQDWHGRLQGCADAATKRQSRLAADRRQRSGLTTASMTPGFVYLDHGKYDKHCNIPMRPCKLRATPATNCAGDAADEHRQRALSKGEYQDALTYFQQAYDIAPLNQEPPQSPCTTWR